MIEETVFGSMTILGKCYEKDLKIIDGNVVANWWRNRGHFVDENDIADILDNKPDMLVVGTGIYGAVQIVDSLKAILPENNIQLIAKPTPEAAAKFNRLLSENKKVAGAFHLTC